MHSADPQRVVGGRFELERVAGSGGMGDVYFARDRQDGAPVALKVLRSSDAQLITRFQREARSAANLQHPNIVTIFDFGELEGPGLPYIVMELLEGTSLAHLMEEKKPERLEDRIQRVAGQSLCSHLGLDRKERSYHRASCQ